MATRKRRQARKSHTQGPWRAYLDPPKRVGRWRNVLKIIGTTDYRKIATVEDIADDEEQDANARLIAATPQMYAFLKRAARLCPATDTDTMLGTELAALLAEINGT